MYDSGNMAQLLTNHLYLPPNCQDGRLLSMRAPSYGQQNGPVLFEWSTTVQNFFPAYITAVRERVPTDDGVSRVEEARTLKIEECVHDHRGTAVIYNCIATPTSLREILRCMSKPAYMCRQTIAYYIATQVRSLYVHFDIVHMALRSDSFVYYVNLNPDYSHPYVIDWARTPSPMHQHPNYQQGQSLWFYDAWSLLMVLSEIAEWRAIENDAISFQPINWYEKKIMRMQMVVDPNWKCEATARVFQYGFSFLQQDHHVLANMNKWQVKGFYDQICKYLS